MDPIGGLSYTKMTSDTVNRYRLVQGASNASWLVPDNGNPDLIWCDEHDPNSKGCGGRSMKFSLTNGDFYTAQGPWNSNPDALFEDTSIDLRFNYTMYLKVINRELHDHLCPHLKGRCYFNACQQGIVVQEQHSGVNYCFDQERRAILGKLYPDHYMVVEIKPTHGLRRPISAYVLKEQS